MAEINYIKHERISLKSHPDLNERWLQDRIAEDPGILGLGDVILLDRERPQERAGRLDLLLADPEGNDRYEVELMLGATDESHIIRCIEYWDIERRRYPGYEHCAVLIAEDITSRFLNVISLLAGTVPIIAIQINAPKGEGGGDPELRPCPRPAAAPARRRGRVQASADRPCVLACQVNASRGADGR